MYGESLARIVRAEKVHVVMFNCISVTDDIKSNEQSNPIAKGPLYVQTEFENRKLIALTVRKF